jgi:hypothetical protein
VLDMVHGVFDLIARAEATLPVVRSISSPR